MANVDSLTVKIHVDVKTLRDEFAMAALTGMLSHPTRYRPRAQDKGLTFHQAISREAVEIADAMMEAHKS